MSSEYQDWTVFVLSIICTIASPIIRFIPKIKQSISSRGCTCRMTHATSRVQIDTLPSIGVSSLSITSISLNCNLHERWIQLDVAHVWIVREKIFDLALLRNTVRGRWCNNWRLDRRRSSIASLLSVISRSLITKDDGFTRVVTNSPSVIARNQCKYEASPVISCLRTGLSAPPMSHWVRETHRAARFALRVGAINDSRSDYK